MNGILNGPMGLSVVQRTDFVFYHSDELDLFALLGLNRFRCMFDCMPNGSQDGVYDGKVDGLTGFP